MMRPYTALRSFAHGAAALIAALTLALEPLHATASDGDCNADAGTLSGYKPTDCLVEGGTWIGGIPNGDAVVPPGFNTLFVLTEGPGLVIQAVSNSPIFQVQAIGAYTVHTLVYDPNTLDLSIVELGVTTGFDVNSLLLQGGGAICASLDVAGTSILVDNPDSGALLPDGEPCLKDGEALLVALPGGDAYVPNGYEVLYVLTQGEGLVIIDVSSSPEFTVTSEDFFTIHTLIYDPEVLDLGGVVLGETTGFEVNGLLYQGGGNICGALDVEGALFSVKKCKDKECTAAAGTLTPDAFEVCLEDGVVTLSASINNDQVLPDGFSVVFVLTQGEGLVIVDAGGDPVFEVEEEGLYTIHTLIFDPTTLDLNGVIFGETTGFDVVDLIMETGACASLDVEGAPIYVSVCEPPPCLADAGTLTQDAFETCLENGEAILSATPDGNAVEPDGFSTLFVLTQGEELVIMQVSASPEFVVEAEGLYTIHTLVYDENTLDLGVVEFGVTTGGDVLGIIAQNDLCASLDAAGAPIYVSVCEPPPCLADAGTLTADAFETCLEDGEAVLSATPDGNAVEPEGFSTLFVLTQGEELVIMQVSQSPEFVVEAEGLFTIHTLIFDGTLDLGVVEFGVTTGGDVLGIIAQNDLCASLDAAGAPIYVSVCEPPPCLASAGTLTADALETCLENGEAILSATPDGNAVEPEGFSTLFVLTQGEELVIMQVSASPEFVVEAEGLFTIHTLIFDGTLDLGVVEFGVTTGGDVLELIAQNDLCASLDAAGAPIEVVTCAPPCTAGEDATITLCFTDGPIALLSLLGETVCPGGAWSAPNANAFGGFFDPATDPEGEYTYMVALNDGTTAMAMVTVFLIECPSGCDADAGTLDAVEEEPCAGSEGTLIEAVFEDQPTVPVGYELIHVLTSTTELIIEAVGDGPAFIVDATGLYTIHTLVYDPATLDLGIVEFGTTPASTVFLLTEAGGGNICASLDVNGAKVTVLECEVEVTSGIALSIFPNPADLQLVMDLDVRNGARTEYSVLDISGREVIPATPAPAGVSRTNIAVHQLRPGQYFLRLVSGEQVETRSFLRME